jgi:hypothetical protein
METQNETTQATQKKGICWVRLVVVLVILAILYGLSFGYVNRLDMQGTFKNHRRTSVILRIVYAPIIWAHHHTPLRKPIDHYVHLWAPPPNR